MRTDNLTMMKPLLDVSAFSDHKLQCKRGELNCNIKQKELKSILNQKDKSHKNKKNNDAYNLSSKKKENIRWPTAKPMQHKKNLKFLHANLKNFEHLNNWINFNNHKTNLKSYQQLNDLCTTCFHNHKTNLKSYQQLNDLNDFQ